MSLLLFVQGLWRFTQRVLNKNGLPDWQLSPDGSIVGTGSASDADVDIALALLVASEKFEQKKWNNNGSTTDTSYISAAKVFIENIYDSEVSRETFMLEPGDSWCEDDVTECNPTYNPSYFSPAHFSLFAEVTGNTGWNKVIDAGFSFLSDDCAVHNKGTGLVADWTESTSDCTPGKDQIFWDRDNGADYYYDAIRTPWRLALSAAWDCEERALAQEALLAAFFRSTGAEGLQRGFTVEGVSLGEEGDSSCFISTSATAMVPGPYFSASNGTSLSLDARHRRHAQGTIESWWEATLNSADDDAGYFCTTLRLLSLIFQAGISTRPLL